MKLLVTGGAGYIGSETVALLVKNGHEVVVLDSLELGHSESLAPDIELIKGRTDDTLLLDNLLSSHQFDGLIHFAAYIQVGESVANPAKYFDNNTAASLKLFEAATVHGVKCVVFSSTAAVYGNPTKVPIDEDSLKQPTNPYGMSKLMTEQMLGWMDQAYGLKSVCLRYFNAAGAALDGSRGEAHQPESHLIPLVLQTAAGKRKRMTLFGNDYDTVDGTCVRDYIHIADLASAHLLAMEYLSDGGDSQAFNLGTGYGYSNLELIEMAKRMTGRPIEVEFGPRRPGDPAQLVASSQKLQHMLNWRPEHSDLETIIKTAWQWQQHPRY